MYNADPNLYSHYNLPPSDLRQYTALTLAVGVSNEELIEILCKPRSDIFVLINKHTNTQRDHTCKIDINRCDGRGLTPLTAAVAHGKAELVELLLNKNADPNRCDNRGYSPLTTAVINNHPQIINILIRHNADIHKSDNHGKSPLTLASETNKIPSIKALVSNGAAPDQSDENMYNPLTKAVHSNALEAITCLVEETEPKANINCHDERGWLPITLAVKNNNYAMINHLCNLKGEVRLNLNQRDKSGKTSLIYAIEAHNYQMVNGLINKGASPSYPDKQGKSPLLYAQSYPCDLSIVTLLKKYIENDEKNDGASTSPKKPNLRTILEDRVTQFQNKKRRQGE
jgi:ankyrin repeat protein